MLRQKELLVISSLRRNSRQSLTDMSKAINIPISTIFDILKVHEKTFIRKHTSLIDFSQLGFGTKAAIVIKTRKEDREALRSFLIAHQNVNSLYKTNSDYDFLAIVIFKNLKDLETFIETISNRFEIENKTYYIVDDIKREEFFSDPNIIDLVI